MSILSDEQFTLLNFIRACNLQRYRPTAAEVENWHRNPKPRLARYRTVVYEDDEEDDDPFLGRTALDSIFGIKTPAQFGISPDVVGPVFKNIGPRIAENLVANSLYGPRLRRGKRSRQVLDRPEETVLAHMTRLGWLTDDGGLSLTPLGEALHSGHGLDTRPGGVDVLVLDDHDELAYPLLIGRMSVMGPGLLIDPYLTTSGLQDILHNTKIDRILVREDKNSKKNGHLAAFAVFLASAPRAIEIRASQQLHDRHVLPDEGEPYSLGTSIRSVGDRAMTLFTPIPSSAVSAVREHSEGLWETAIPVAPAPST